MSVSTLDTERAISISPAAQRELVETSDFRWKKIQIRAQVSDSLAKGGSCKGECMVEKLEVPMKMCGIMVCDEVHYCFGDGECGT